MFSGADATSVRGTLMQHYISWSHHRSIFFLNATLKSEFYLRYKIKSYSQIKSFFLDPRRLKLLHPYISILSISVFTYEYRDLNVPFWLRSCHLNKWKIMIRPFFNKMDKLNILHTDTNFLSQAHTNSHSHNSQ